MRLSKLNRGNKTMGSRKSNDLFIARKWRKQDQAAFLPATLEVLETPPAPFGRLIAIVIAAFFILAVLWAYLGTVDVIAVAQGKIIPSGNIKIVQPLETGVVRAIHVREGQHIRQNDTLIELDPTENEANIDTLEFDLIQARLDQSLGKALLSDNPATDFTPPKGAPKSLTHLTHSMLKDQVGKHKASLEAIKAEIKRNEAHILSTKIETEKLQQSIPMIEERLQIQEALFEKGLVRKPVILALKLDLLEKGSALKNMGASRTQALAAIQALKARRAETISAFRANAADQRQSALRKIATLSQDLKKAQQRKKYRALKSPVDGTVLQLSVHTIGAVVSTSEKLVTIVPNDTVLEIEALVLNKDIGFVEEGQEVEIKLEAFPFTRYGIIHGKLKALSRDAMVHERLGPVFKAKVALNSQHIKANGKTFLLTPGMNVTAEIKTGSRRILDFFLSPLLRYKQEAIRER